MHAVRSPTPLTRDCQPLVRQAISLDLHEDSRHRRRRPRARAWPGNSPRERGVTEVICAPGNPGIAAVARCIAGRRGEPDGAAGDRGPRGGRSDRRRPRAAAQPRRRRSVRRRRPRRSSARRKAAAALESSKAFAKDFMARHGVPTARFRVCDSADAALDGDRARRVRLSARAQGRRPRGRQGRGHRRGSRRRRGRGARGDGRSPFRRGRRARRARRVPRRRGGVVLRPRRRHRRSCRCRRRRITSASSTTIAGRTPAAWARSRRARC